MINCDRFVRAYEKFCKVFKRKWFRCNWVSGSGELWFAVVGYLYNCLYRRSASPATPINVLPTRNEFKDPIPPTELWRLSVKWNFKYAVAEVLLRHGIFVLCLKDTCIQSTVCILCIAIFVPRFLVLVISLSLWYNVTYIMLNIASFKSPRIFQRLCPKCLPMLDAR